VARPRPCTPPFPASGMAPLPSPNSVAPCAAV
jgi:hypothetical protein